MKRGKRICNELKAVRRRIAEENGIDLHQSECTHTGECRGTCPRCEAEVRYLEQALEARVRLGRAATVAGLSLSLAACGGHGEKLSVDTPLTEMGDVELTESETTQSDSSADNREETPTEVVVTGMEGDAFTYEEVTTGEFIIDTDTTDEADDELIEGEPEIFVFVEENPSFPGGEEALYKFIDDNLRYPARDICVTGTVVVRFVVEKDGSISGARVLREIGGGCGREALRVVGMMPQWNPGKQNGKAVRCEFTLPVNFELK